MERSIPPESGVTVDLIYDIEVEAAEHFNFLPIDVAINDEWDATQMTATVTMDFDVQGLPAELAAAAPPIPTIIATFSVSETGVVLDTESVETDAGTFDDCLKIEFRTDTELTTNEPEAEGPENPLGETVTTVWLAPNVGIVKYHQESQKMFLNIMSDKEFAEASVSEEEAAEITASTIKSFELTNYEIANIPDDVEGRNE